MQALEQLLEELRVQPSHGTGEWLARLVDAIRPRRREGAAVAESSFRVLLQLLESKPEYAAALNEHLGTLLASRMHRILYADAGVLGPQGFFGSLARRILGRLLPPAVDTEYLRDLVAEVFDQPRDYAWLRAIPRDDWDALLRAIDVDGEAFAPARTQPGRLRGGPDTARDQAHRH